MGWQERPGTVGIRSDHGHQPGSLEGRLPAGCFRQQQQGLLPKWGPATHLLVGQGSAWLTELCSPGMPQRAAGELQRATSLAFGQEQDAESLPIRLAVWLAEQKGFLPPHWKQILSALPARQHTELRGLALNSAGSVLGRADVPRLHSPEPYAAGWQANEDGSCTIPSLSALTSTSNTSFPHTYKVFSIITAEFTLGCSGSAGLIKVCLVHGYTWCMFCCAP